MVEHGDATLSKPALRQEEEDFCESEGTWATQWAPSTQGYGDPVSKTEQKE